VHDAAVMGVLRAESEAPRESGIPGRGGRLQKSSDQSRHCENEEGDGHEVRGRDLEPSALAPGR